MSRRWTTVAVLVALLAPALEAAEADRVGAPITPWQPGALDIHQISTGRGNAAFMILPDGRRPPGRTGPR